MSHLLIFFILLVFFMPVTLLANNNVSLTEGKNLENSRPALSIEIKNIEESSQIIKEIISKEPFVNIQQERVWNFKAEDSDNDKEDTLIALNWLTNIITGISTIIEFILWVIPILVVLYLYTNRKNWLALIAPRKSHNENMVLPDTLFGLDMRPDNFPDNIEMFAQELWENNKKRQAISLLYRGALIFVFSKNRFTLSSGATEQDCLRYLKIHNNSKQLSNNVHNDITLNRFSLITDHWINVAYAHKLPTDEVFYGLSKGWNTIFRPSELNKNGH